MHLFELTLRDSDDQIRRAKYLIGNPTETDGIIAKFSYDSEPALNAALNKLSASGEHFVIDVVEKFRVER